VFPVRYEHYPMRVLNKRQDDILIYSRHKPIDCFNMLDS
jgi:hypothetical protein